ncbi:angiopoietin-related protein 7 isoform X2 [Zeugodacus cucurbitae]|uniref:angiopoietin-related protein 7 isoform X2 n=1 Tax=Zeugodacus cucurbitae TaxID=28588 RepID=UPI0023D907A9|nr:angiopoietin-related protein 7 isoform X2 [Zeugodacus cucurbitae]
MFFLQRGFVTIVTFSILILIYTDTVSCDSQQASENPSDELNSFVTVLAEYMLNHTDEVSSRFIKDEQTIKEVLQKQTELNKEINVTPRSCAEILPNLSAGNSGIYNITPLNMSPFEVFCLTDPKGGCGWTLVWRRNEINDDFNRTWAEYRNGFGELTDNFFIGLDKLYALTIAEPQQLRMGIKYGSNNWELDIFDEFVVGNVCTQYELVITNPQNKRRIFKRLNKRAHFFTKDLSSSSKNEECAKAMGMGWWYTDDCKNYLKSRVYYRYINSPTYMVIRPQSCDIKN